ncbi:Cysteine-rich receptor-like protein kinase [Thalictrum thalictroides]|uniref:Cysteine-rich receptor-like protein kinase n=1 Tax=Thalictrum thalictroides TaxID=46969 RepID=A0A7J6WSJ8_THATH|nr:Cysteine-rich receptor-like protein kinase [Thalictrum thalictroides]
MRYYFGLFILVLSFTFQFNLNTAQIIYLYKFCRGDNYTSNSTYESNLKLLLSSLSSNTKPNNTRFYNATSGSFPDRVYGQFQCRVDIPIDICNRCVTTASDEIVFRRCSNKIESIIWYGECMLRYSNESITSVMQLSPTYWKWNTINVTDPNRFNPVLDRLMDRLVTQAVYNSTDMFAIGEANLTVNDKIYGLVQCTQDINRTACNQCLRNAVGNMSEYFVDKVGGRGMKPSCHFRYEIYKFYFTEDIQSVPPPRASPPSTANVTKGQKKTSRTVVIIVVPILIVVVLLSAIMIYFCFRKAKKFEIATDDDEMKNIESLQFSIKSIRTATEKFSDANKLGEGGFGAVYKGRLADGKEIAVKRLSKNSAQGAIEFKNEVLLLAKLHHKNLVRLLGFCLEGDEKLLIYEFVLNSSLDQFIFDPIKRTYLNWETRNKIIEGIAQGLVYLHEDFEHKIIHRDLKAANVLLDAEMNPKIADFGMARLFLVDQTHADTKRVVGTFGYMAPEYVMHGQFSTKSDVYSFGVLILEIISGRKNNQSEYEDEDLLTYAWRHWEEGTALDVLEPALKEQNSRTEVMRCIHIGLLCVQEDVALRPTMASVVLMLSNDSISLSLPLAPAFSFSSRRESPTSREHGGNTMESSQMFVMDQSIRQKKPSNKVLIITIPIVIEIITGRKSNHSVNVDDILLSYVWRHWEKGTALEVIEPALREQTSRTEVIRCIHIGLLCVQGDVALRPTMASVVLMLSNYSVSLSLPSPPAFYFRRESDIAPTPPREHEAIAPDGSTNSSTCHSINEVSITELYPR